MTPEAPVERRISLYRFRYIFGYIAIFALMIAVLSIDISSLPSGISDAEMRTAVGSSHFGSVERLDWIINAPYHFVQQISITSLGLSRLSLVLPSLLFGAATLFIFMQTMRFWFKRSIAVTATIVAVSNTAFITMARSGTPDIMLSFWTILLLLAAVKLLIVKKNALIWKVLIMLSSVGLLFTPFGIYPLAIFVISGLFHPHIRSRIRKIKRLNLILLALAATAIASPLVLLAIKSPEGLVTLSGIREMAAGASQPLNNLRTLFDYYANVLHGRLEYTTILPTFGIATLFLALLGFLRTIKDRYTARSYALLAWIGVTVVVIGLVPTLQSFILMPVLLLLTIGIDTLINDWYKLFPKNPYARIAGLIPLMVLFATVAMTNITHYFYTFRYNTPSSYDQSLPAIKQELSKHKDRPTFLVTTEKKADFFALVQKEYPRVSVVTTARSGLEHPTLVTPGASVPYSMPPSHIYTTYTQDSSAILRVYNPR